MREAGTGEGFDAFDVACLFHVEHGAWCGVSCEEAFAFGCGGCRDRACIEAAH